jgi:GDP-L-fucose synthase
MKILLTGATGFVGNNVLKRLISENRDVTPVGSRRYDLRRQCEVEMMFNRVKPSVVIHLAGSVGGIGANKENPGKFMYDNLIMGTNMIHQASISNVKKFIQIGTVCAYPKITPIPFKENNLWNGYPEETNAPYGLAKRVMGILLKSYNEQYSFQGTHLIPVNMYGPYDHFNLTSSHVIPALILKVHQAINNGDKEITLWGTGVATREFLYVDDFAEAISLSIDTPTNTDPINIGTGKEISIDSLIKTICDVMNYDGNIVYDTSKPDGQPRRCLDTSEAKSRMGFTAKTGLREGLIKTVEYFRRTNA